MRLRVVLALAIWLVPMAGVGQGPVVDLPVPPGVVLLDPEWISFHFERSGLVVPVWGIEVNRDGSGTYWEPAAVTDENRDGRASRPIHISGMNWKRMLGGQATIGTGRCETKAKHIADTGRKQIGYGLGPLRAECVFNYSDDKFLMAAAEVFEAVAETMQAGERLERKRRFDRLGLDAETLALAQEIKDGRAIEIGNIAPVLERIARDGEVMERVRVRVAGWLKGS